MHLIPHCISEITVSSDLISRKQKQSIISHYKGGFKHVLGRISQPMDSTLYTRFNRFTIPCHSVFFISCSLFLYYVNWVLKSTLTEMAIDSAEIGDSVPLTPQPLLHIHYLLTPLKSPSPYSLGSLLDH